MLKLAKITPSLLDWWPSGVGLRWVLAMGWWLVLGRLLRHSLRAALGGAAAGAPCRIRTSAGPPTKPRRPKPRPRRACPDLAYPSAA